MKDTNKKDAVNPMENINVENAVKEELPEVLDVEQLKEVAGGAFDDFPRIHDNDYDEDIIGRI